MKDYARRGRTLDLTPPPPLPTQCFKAIQLDYNLAVQHAVAMADYYNEYYTFVDIAKNPAATPMNILPHWKRVQKIAVYKEKVDLVGELYTLAKSLVANRTVPGAPTVPLADVMFPIQDIFNRLRDTHVAPYGVTPDNYLATSFGDVLNGVVPRLFIWGSTPDQTSVDLSAGKPLFLNFKTAAGKLFVTGPNGERSNRCWAAL